ncbi:MAG: ROK family protein [Pseudomonadota bacterium]
MRMGVDLGGTKIEAILMDRHDQVVQRKRVLTPKGNYHATMDKVRQLALEIEAMAGESCTIGIGIPGAISPVTGKVKNANSTCLIGHRLKEDLENLLARAIKVENDANCFALSEALDGSGQGASGVFGIILGTGMGGGLVIKGQLVSGQNAIAGEWGHNPLPWPEREELPGPPCYCGKRGCLETLLSGPGMVQDHLRHAPSEASATLTAETLWQAAAQGEPHAKESVQRYQSRLARSLASVVNLLDPDVIVLGGGLSNQKELYQNLPGLIRPFVFSDRVTTQILPPQHGDSSGVRGAARLWPAEPVDPQG